MPRPSPGMRWSAPELGTIWARARLATANAAGMSSAVRMSWTCSATPSERAAPSIAFTCIGAMGSARNDSTSTRKMPGTSSLSSSSRLTASWGTINDIPVMLSEGLERLSTSPVPSGSPRATMTIGTVRVAFFRRWAAGVVVTAMTSGLRLRHSSIRVGNRSPLLSAER